MIKCPIGRHIWQRMFKKCFPIVSQVQRQLSQNLDGKYVTSIIARSNEDRIVLCVYCNEDYTTSTLARPKIVTRKRSSSLTSHKRTLFNTKSWPVRTNIVAVLPPKRGDVLWLPRSVEESKWTPPPLHRKI